MTPILMAINVAGIIINAWLLIRLLKSKRLMKDYCQTAFDASKIALSVQQETIELRDRARLMLAEAKRRLEEARDTAKA